MQHHLIACDPGVKKSALAIFDVTARLQYLEFWEGFAYECEILAIEIPRIYPAQKQIGDPNDIVDLAVAAGIVIGSIISRKVVRWSPREWKGQVDKPLCHDRIWQVLSPTERQLFPSDTETRIQKGLDGGPYSSKVHNLLDAAGLGLVTLGRNFQ